MTTAPEPSTLALELEEQRRWRLRSKWEGLDLFDRLVRNEFLSADEHAARADAAVRQIVGYAAEHIPFYRDYLRGQGIDPGQIDGVDKLPLLPILTKQDLQHHAADLRPAQLPPGQKPGGMARTSGTTGQPAEVHHTAFSRNMFSVLKQRELRWFRFDPDGTFAYIRPPNDLPRRGDGEPIGLNTTCYHDSWPSAGRYFHTGPFRGFSDLNPVEAQVEWLQKHSPDYVLGQSAQLEHLALGFPDHPPPPNLRAFEAISQQLTPDMRYRIESTFGVPVQQNYGLNEIGIVAVRCPEGGRYHVHTEHCLVEVVDDEGHPVAPGERGRLLVTGLSNAAMPLIRYDADDMAVAAEGPCPCGRTLPGFQDLVGRYRRTIALPPGTWGYWDTLLYTLGHAPRELITGLRKYQLHQYRDGSFELRLESSALPDALMDAIHAAWRRHGGAESAPLAIQVLEDIPRPAGGKFQNFTSDYAPFPAPVEDADAT